jgi:hypothetical protein
MFTTSVILIWIISSLSWIQVPIWIWVIFFITSIGLSWWVDNEVEKRNRNYTIGG